MTGGTRQMALNKSITTKTLAKKLGTPLKNFITKQHQETEQHYQEPEQNYQGTHHSEHYDQEYEYGQGDTEHVQMEETLRH